MRRFEVERLLWDGGWLGEAAMMLHAGDTIGVSIGWWLAVLKACSSLCKRGFLALTAGSLS